MRGRLAFSLVGSWVALVALIQGCSTDSSNPAGSAGSGAAMGGNAAQGGNGTNPQAGSGTNPQAGSGTNPQAGSSTAGSTVGGNGSSGASTGGTGNGTAGGPPLGGGPAGPSVGAAQFGAGDLDAASNGATLTFQNIGKMGSYPSRRAAKSASCDIKNTDTCCLTTQQVTSDKLTPWDQDLIVQLRGPMQVKQFVVYQPAAGDQKWNVVSAWDSAKAAGATAIQFDGNATPGAKFTGTVGSQCVIDALTDKPFGCGDTSVPYCDAKAAGIPKNWGWAGSKLFVIAARMPMMGGNLIDAATACGQGTGNNWYNAPWIGVSLGELVREDKFGPCNCYGSIASPLDGKGCGQLNAFEVVNDNNDYQNFNLFSSNFFSYANNVGEGPCGKNCNVTGVGPADLIDKATSQPATKGGVTIAGGQAAHVAFRRPETGYRYFLILFDVATRQVQLAIIHPSKVPTAAATVLPTLPTSIDRTVIDGLLNMRLPG